MPYSDGLLAHPIGTEGPEKKKKNLVVMHNNGLKQPKKKENERLIEAKIVKIKSKPGQNCIQRFKLYNHACACSCVGPIVDVKEQYDLFYREVYG